MIMDDAGERTFALTRTWLSRIHAVGSVAAAPQIFAQGEERVARISRSGSVSDSRRSLAQKDQADATDPTAWLRLSAVLCLLALPCFGKSPLDYVNPMIGTDEHGHVYPGATAPFGMVQLSPDTRDNGWDGCSGYHYSDSSILGFSHNHLTGTGCGDLGNILLMPTVGALRLIPGDRPGEGYRARFSHADETARPGYYSVLLPDYGVKVELTATERTGFHRYTFPATDQAHVVVDLQHGIANNVTEAQLTIEDDRTASGYRRSEGWGGGKVYYFVMEFSRPFDSAGAGQADKDAPGKQSTGRETKGHFDFKTKAGEQILVRVGLSTVSVEGARKNLRAEIPNWDFDAVAAATAKKWRQALSAFEVETRDENLKQTFYTALYHGLLAPTILSDVDGQFRGPDGQVHRAEGYDYYTEMSLWDTFRAENPLLTLIQPQRVNDFVKTMLEHYKDFGHHTLPIWPNGGKETWCMIGNHAIPVIVDAYLKGFRDWNADEALDDMIAATSLNREQQDAYRELGFVPSKHDVQSVSKTLEYAYDDSCISRFAAALGRADVAEKYGKPLRAIGKTSSIPPAASCAAKTPTALGPRPSTPIASTSTTTRRPTRGNTAFSRRRIFPG